MRRLTRRQRELKARYINIIKEYGGYRAILSIGVQGFGIGYVSEGKRSAQWMGSMLAIALENLVILESKER